MPLHQTNCNFALITSVMTKQWNLVGWVARHIYKGRETHEEIGIL